MKSRVGEHTALGLGLLERVQEDAEGFLDTPPQQSERSTLTHRIAAAVEAFETPYASEDEYYFVTNDEDYGEVIELGQPKRNARIFPNRAFRRNRETINQFMAFADGQDQKNWRFWCIKIPDRKATVDALAAEIKRFNDKINISFSELRKKKIFEPLLLTLHIRYDHNEEAFDLHLHMICRIEPDRYDEIYKQLGNKFSLADLELDAPIRNLRACATYMVWGIIPHKDLPTWPRRALEPVWQHSLTGAQLMRPCGGFRAWRAEQAKLTAGVKLTKEERQELRRVKAEAQAKLERNRAEVAHPGHGQGQDRCLGRRTFISPIDGRRRTGLLYRRRLPKAVPATPPDAPASGRLVNARSKAGIAPAKLTKPSALLTIIQGRSERVRRPRAWWWLAWPHGGHGWAGRPPGPIRRRLARCQASLRHLAGPILDPRAGLSEAALAPVRRAAPPQGRSRPHDGHRRWRTGGIGWAGEYR